MAKEDILDAIKAFVGRARSQESIDRVAKFHKRAASQGDVTTKPLFGDSGQEEWNSILAFFAPVGYRPLFEQEITFLMSEGISYGDIMGMPIYLRKKLVDKKLGKNEETNSMDGDPVVPDALMQQYQMAQKYHGPKQQEPEPAKV